MVSGRAGTHSTPSSSSAASLEPYSDNFRPFSGKLTLAVSFSRVRPAHVRHQRSPLAMLRTGPLTLSQVRTVHDDDELEMFLFVMPNSHTRQVWIYCAWLDSDP
jgi:hypothetical protein